MSIETAAIPAQRARTRLTAAQRTARIREAAETAAAARTAPLDADWTAGEWYWERMNRLNGDD